MPHDFKPDADRLEPNCQECGSKYHCAACREGCGMMGHVVRDADGEFHQCQDEERYQRHLDHRVFLVRRNDIGELRKLVERYPEEAATLLEGLSTTS